MSPHGPAVILFESVSAALLAERILKESGIPAKTIPVPRHISRDCGVCIRVDEKDLDRARLALGDKVRAVQSLTMDDVDKGR
jgi:hypothetical protein